MREIVKYHKHLYTKETLRIFNKIKCFIAKRDLLFSLFLVVCVYCVEFAIFIRIKVSHIIVSHTELN